MGKPHPIELRKRVVDYVEEGHSHRSAASRFCVSIKFVNDMVKLKRETGALEPKPFRLASVALANKLARIAWVILTKDETYQPYKQAA